MEPKSICAKGAVNINSIYWNIYGKVQQIVFDTAQDSTMTLTFAYDPLGNRIEKVWTRTKYYCPTCIVPFGIHYRTDTTKYSRDAQGNILAVYNRQRDSVWLNEWDIYGNKRIGVSMSKEHRNIIQKLNRNDWLKLLNNNTTDWAANLLLYNLYNLDAVVFQSIITNREDWIPDRKDQDILYWSDFLKDKK